MERLLKFALLTYASLSLLLGWLSAAVAFLFLACGIVGAVVGHALWSFACRVIGTAASRLERHSPQEKEVGAQ
jgi:hypothetical protein